MGTKTPDEWVCRLNPDTSLLHRLLLALCLGGALVVASSALVWTKSLSDLRLMTGFSLLLGTGGLVMTCSRFCGACFGPQTEKMRVRNQTLRKAIFLARLLSGSDALTVADSGASTAHMGFLKVLW